MSAMWLIIIIIIAVPRTGSIQFFAGRPKCEEGGVEARAPVSEAGPKSSGGKAGTKKKNRFLSQQQPWCGRRVPRPVRRGRRPWVTMPASLLRLLVPDSLARPPKRLDSFFLHSSHSDIFLLILVYLNTSINSGTYLATTVVLVAVIISAE